MLGNVLRSRQKQHSQAKLLSGYGRQAVFRQPAGQEVVGDLRHDAHTVAGFGIGVHRSTMRQVRQCLQRALDDAVLAHPRDVGYEAHAACVMLEARIVQGVVGVLQLPTDAGAPRVGVG